MDQRTEEREKEIREWLTRNPHRAMELMERQYAGLLFQVAGQYLEDPEDRKECVNDTFVEFYFHRERYDGTKGSLAAYLTAILRNRAVSMYRRNQSWRTMPLTGGDAGSTADEIATLEDRVVIEETLSVLKPEDAALIRMKYYDGMTLREIADSLGLTYEAVKKRHQRTLAQMKGLMAAPQMPAAGGVPGRRRTNVRPRRRRAAAFAILFAILAVCIILLCVFCMLK